MRKINKYGVGTKKRRGRWQFDPKRAFNGTMLQGMPPLTPREPKVRVRAAYDPAHPALEAAEQKRERRRARNLALLNKEENGKN